MNAQTVVDTFAPFVGTEGLVGIAEVRLDTVHPSRVIIVDKYHPEYLVHPNIAHGFLLSLLAQSLAFCGWTFWSEGWDTDTVWLYLRRPNEKSMYEHTYADAVLAAAQVEWPKREPAEPDEILVTFEIAGKRFNMIARDPQLVAAIRKYGIDGVMQRMDLVIID